MLQRVLCFALLFSGCAVDDDAELTEVDAPLLAANKLAANKLAANKLAANKLAATSLQSQQLMSSADGREVMSYIVGCALPTGTSVTLKDTANVSYTYPGWIGLAPAWTTRVPTVTERRWVTACLLARTNLYGISVQISMRGAAPVLATTATETNAFKSGEGAFYGDLFAATPALFACSGKYFATTADAGVESLRACTRSTSGTSTLCGFTFTGYCGTAYTDGRPAPCTRGTNGLFGPCAGATTSYAEAITIYLDR